MAAKRGAEEQARLQSEIDEDDAFAVSDGREGRSMCCEDGRGQCCGLAAVRWRLSPALAGCAVRDRPRLLIITDCP